MKIKYFFLTFFSFFFFDSFSQPVSGTIYDENKNPAIGISVYLDGTTSGTTTDINGNFSINSQKINTSLVISAIGYETIFVENPFENNNQKFYLTVKSESLKEIVVRKELFSRKQKLAVFRAYFLGKTKAGRSCTILNEDDIDLEYDYDRNILFATSKNPIQIVNSYLGYEVDFSIYKFDIQFQLAMV